MVSLCILTPAFAENSIPVQQLAEECNVCHQVDTGSLETLYGMSQEKFIASIKRYQDGSLNDPLMNAAVQDLDDATLDALAQYYRYTTVE